MKRTERRVDLWTIVVLIGVAGIAWTIRPRGERLELAAGSDGTAAAVAPNVADPTPSVPPLLLTQIAGEADSDSRDAGRAEERERRRRENEARSMTRAERRARVAAEVEAAERQSILTRIGGMMGGLAVDGERAFTVVGDELLVLGVDFDRAIEIRAREAGVSGLPLGVAAIGAHVYVASMKIPSGTEIDAEPEASLVQFEIDGTGQPHRIGEVLSGLNRDIRSMAARNGRLAMSVGNDIVIIDASDPAHVSIVGEIPGRGHTESLAWDGDVLYATSRGFRAFDVSDPASPIEVGSVLEDKAVMALAIGDRVGYAVDCFIERSMSVIDLENPLAPAVVEGAGDHIDFEDCEGPSLVVDGDLLWLASDGVVQVFDVSDPIAPIEIARTAAPTGDEGGFAAKFADRLLVIDGFGLGASEFRLEEGRGLRGGSLMLWPHSVSSVASSTSSGFDPLSDALLAIDPSGLWVLDVDDPRDVKVRSRLPNVLLDVGEHRRSRAANTDRLPEPRFPVRVRSYGGRAYIVFYDGEVVIVDMADFDAPRAMGQIDTYGASDVVVRANIAYVTSSEGLIVADMTDPESPGILAHLPELASDQSIASIAVNGDRAIVLGGRRRDGSSNRLDTIVELDLGPESDPIVPPRVVDQLELPGKLMGLAIAGDALYVATESLLKRFELDSPAPLSTGNTVWPRDGEPFHAIRFMEASEDDGRLLIEDHIGLQVFDPITLERLWLAGSTESGPTLSVVMDGGRAYVPGWLRGLSSYALDGVRPSDG